MMTQPNKTTLTDFPDRLSPVLVKELRQGLRTNLFVIAFILLQAFMILTILTTSDQNTNGSSVGWAYWTLIFIATLIVQPIRGFSSLSSEYSAHTMDLIQLTNLNALRITFGKWFAINAQTLLLIITVIPYLMLRYFSGSVNLGREGLLLLFFTISSGILSAITVGCSAFKHVLPRIILVVGFCTLFFTLFSHSLTYFNEFKEWLVAAFTGLLVGLYFLFFGASRIAPLSENHATRKRILGLIGVLAMLGFYFLKVDIEIIGICATVILGLTVLDAITEELPIFHGVLPPFKANFLTRISGAFLSPGWHTGVFFLFVVSLPYFFLMYSEKPKSKDIVEFISICFLLISAVCLPFVFIHLFFRRSTTSKLLLYLFIQACILGISFLVCTFAESASSDAQELIYLLAPLPAVLLAGESYIDDYIVFVISSVWLAITFLFLFLATRRPFREMREYYKGQS